MGLLGNSICWCNHISMRFQSVLTNNAVANDKVSYSSWKEVKRGAPQASIVGPLPFLLYINNLPKIATKDANVILFADHTNIIATNSNDTHLKIVNEIFMNIKKWCKTNPLSLNFSKTQCLEFRTSNFNDNINVCYNNHCISNTTHPEFLWLIINDTFSCKYRIDRIMSKLNSACLAVRSVNTILAQETLRMIFFFVHTFHYNLIV